MSKKNAGGGKLKPGASIDFTPVIPKFLQGRMDSGPKKKDDDDEDAPTIVYDMPEGKERPDMEGEGPTIVADDEIMALLAKQELVLVDGKLERKESEKSEKKEENDDSVVEFGKRSRAKKSANDSASNKVDGDNKPANDANPKKRASNSNAEDNNPKKREAKKKMLSFDDEEDI